MKRLPAVALALAIALPACAQRGAIGHASLGAHSAPAFHTNVTPAFYGNLAPAPFRYTGGPLVARPSYAPAARLAAPLTRYAPAVSTARPAFYQNHHPADNRRRRVTFIGVVPYGVVYPGYWPYDSFLDDSYDDASAYGPEATPAPQPGPSAAEPSPEPAYPEPPAQAEFEAPPPRPPAAASQPAPEPEDAVTLVFKDGRPAEQIHNYIATRTTITAIDGRHRREIPVSDLDLAATLKANHEAGVDFQLPTGQ